ncbi:hypothetical protein LJC04_01455 [Ruminococcaceae bacterium OttesenSCG-928-O06]|nr:hypothetical protein [Ruminococcaceae bacterium OttesenSCG-928-O06]
MCHGNYNWMVSDMAFVAAFLEKLQRAFARGTTITLINRKGYAIADIAAFAGPWLIAHLKGHIRSRYYEGEMPGNLRFIASIREYWSARVLEDPEVEDSLFLAMYTDVLDIRREVAECDEYLAISRPLSQYHFLQSPAGTPAEKKLWPADGCLPGWNDLEAPDGSFFASMRVPGFGVMTRAEFDQVAEGRAPELPAFLFAGDAGFAPGPHKLVLCAEDVQEGLLKSRRMHEALSEVMGQRAFVPQSMLRAQLRRILAAMAQRDDFEVALVPRVAFASLQMDLICWRNSATVAWLQDRTESVYSFDEATSGAFYGFMGFLWGRLMAGWKNQDRVRRQLRRWLAGKGLESTEPDSAIVRGWRLFPMA